MKQKKLQTMDGCTAAAYVAYAMSEVATIYPITPIASMGEVADKWAMQGRLNIFGGKLDIREMESELGAAGATHGALAAGSFATTFTSSQGLMLMIPNMYKISGELLPGVFHVGTRSLATHALSIFGDHQDVMACRATGFAFLASASVQETLDLALVAHLAAIDGSLPVVHFFDGWRTSNELATIEPIPYDTMAAMTDMDKVKQFRSRGMNPEHPDLRGSAQNSDVYFQNREAANRYYDAFPSIVQSAMDKVAAATGRQYHTVDYVGAPDATDVIVSMGSSTEVVEDAVNYLNSTGRKTGVIKIRLYRPFPTDAFMAALPPTVERIAVLDRTKEPGSAGEPLYLDVAATVLSSGRQIKVIGGRYGLGSKAFDPEMAKSVFDYLTGESARHNFTVGITDDVTHLSLDTDGTRIATLPADVTQAVFYGMGSDGTVGATKQLASIITDVASLYTQSYFTYSAKKSGGYTVSQFRVAPHPIRAAYSIKDADYVGCNKDVYVDRFDMLANLRPGGIFVLNSSWTAADMDTHLPARLRRDIASKKVRFYNVNARDVAEKNGLGVRINTIMATVYLHLMDSPEMPFAKTVEAFKALVSSTYMHEGGDVVKCNLAAIDAAVAAVTPIDYPASWASATDAPAPDETGVPEFVSKIARPCNRLEGNSLPVSLFTPDGTMPMGTTAYEKRRIANNIPAWDSQKCVQCTRCSLVCSHAAIRPYLLTDAEKVGAPAGFVTVEAHAPALKGLNYRIQVYPDDCTGCGSCATVCPGKALDMVPIATIRDQQATMLDYAENHVSLKENLMPRDSVIGSQLRQPLMQFSGACGGCGETPYVKLITQLFGERMLIANATGCSSIWGANFPSNAYCVNSQGHGPAWGNSLFEDNAEYGFGMACALEARRTELAATIGAIADDQSVNADIRQAARAWVDGMNDAAASASAGAKLLSLIKAQPASAAFSKVTDNADILTKKSIWAIGGDGWAYDIGFAGLDHVLAQDKDINILVMDTECYSNTGGQMSKATPISAVMKYAADGKRTYKKDLGRMMMTYGNVYVASIALGANYAQAIKALAEAEAYPGPSIVIAYCPCINHGIRSGMSHSIVEENLAVQTGYWQLYRYNPALTAQGKNPLTVDAPAPDGNLLTFLNGEDRYADLRMVDPKEAAILQPDLRTRTALIYNTLLTQSRQNS